MSKTVSKADFESQMLQKANKQTVANALQRKANKADAEPRLAKIEAQLMFGASGTSVAASGQNGKSLSDRIDELEKNLEDSRTALELALDEKVSKKVNTAEDSLKKLCTRDMQRVDSELLIMNTNISTLTTECRSLDEKMRSFSSASELLPRQSPEPEQIALHVDNSVKSQLKKLGLNAAGPTSFRDSLLQLVKDGSSESILQAGNKEIQ